MQDRIRTCEIRSRSSQATVGSQVFALLNGISFDDLDDDFDTGDRCQFLTHGKAPQVLRFSNANEEFDAVLKEIKALIGGGVSAKNICVVARTHKLLDDYIAQFTANGLRCYEIKGNKADDRGLDGIRVATMHRVKGMVICPSFCKRERTVFYGCCTKFC